MSFRDLPLADFNNPQHKYDLHLHRDDSKHDKLKTRSHQTQPKQHHHHHHHHPHQTDSKHRPHHADSRHQPHPIESKHHKGRKEVGTTITSTRFADLDMDDTIHYLSPASLTMITVQGEDQLQSICTADFYRYLDLQHHGYMGEYSGIYSYSHASTLSIEAEQMLERTCAIIKPEAVYFEDVIVRKILKAGFKILQKRKLHLTPEQVSELYAQYYGQTSFPYLVVSMSAAPVIVMCLTAVNAVAKWRDLVKNTGTLHNSWFFPKSMRIRFGILGSFDNVLHASENLTNACREIRYFFPQTIIEPLLTELNDVTDFLQLYVNPTLLDALTELCKKKPIEPILFFADWLLLNNPYQPKLIPDIARLPT